MNKVRLLSISALLMAAVALASTLMYIAINEMYSREMNINAIARIYVPGGCTYMGVPTRNTELILFLCNNNQVYMIPNPYN